METKCSHLPPLIPKLLLSGLAYVEPGERQFGAGNICGTFQDQATALSFSLAKSQGDLKLSSHGIIVSHASYVVVMRTKTFATCERIFLDCEIA